MSPEHFEIPKTATNLPGDYVGFLCYAHDDDEYSDGGISHLHEKVQQHLRQMTGGVISIFRDVAAIRYGDVLKQSIDGAILETQILLPVMTPIFFTREQCRSEVARFDAREGRPGKIIPIYYVDVPDLMESDDGLKVRLREIKYADFRDIDRGSSEYRTLTRKLASDILAGLPAPSPRQAGPAYEPDKVEYRSAPRSLYVLQNVVGNAGPAATVQYRLASAGGLDLISYPVELREGFFNVSAAFGGTESDAYGRPYVRVAPFGGGGNAQSVTVQILGLPKHADAAEEQITVNLVRHADMLGRVIITFDIGADFGHG